MTIGEIQRLNELIAGVEIVDGFHDVPSADSADNAQMRDVVGNKTDTHDGDSIYSLLDELIDHAHPALTFLYPERAGSVQLQKASGAWAAYPTPTEVIPASTIQEKFDLHFLNVSAISANGEYSIAIYTGAAMSEVMIGAYGAVRNAVQSQEGSRPIITLLIPANTRISMALSSGNAAQDTVNVKVEGHTYP